MGRTKSMMSTLPAALNDVYVMKIGLRETMLAAVYPAIHEPHTFVAKSKVKKVMSTPTSMLVMSTVVFMSRPVRVEAAAKKNIVPLG